MRVVQNNMTINITVCAEAFMPDKQDIKYAFDT